MAVEVALAANAVDRTVARVVRSHAPGLAGTPSRGHRSSRDRERFLRGFLGEVEVAQEADQRSEDATPLGLEYLFDQRATAGCTSIAPLVHMDFIVSPLGRM